MNKNIIKKQLIDNYANYIFDLYGTLIDVEQDEESIEVWIQLENYLNKVLEQKKSKKTVMSHLELSKEYKNECSCLFNEILQKTQYPDFKLEKVFSNILKKNGLNLDSDELHAIILFFRKITTSDLRCYKGVVEYLKLLNEAGVNVYLLSNGQKTFSDMELTKLGIKSYFKNVYFSAEFECSKPDVAFYQILFENENLKKSDSVMIGNDHTTDIKGAFDFGIDSFYIQSNRSKVNEEDARKKVNSKYLYLEEDFFSN